jgi:hypothetical protein
MTSQTRSVTRMPRDIRARERLREAQQAEARALTVVCSSEVALARVCRQRDEVIAAASARVAAFERELATVQASLVSISGLDRAAVLLGLEPSVLRKAVVTAADANASRP